jgi:cytochrome d ubiquinol oxidase subunit II
MAPEIPVAGLALLAATTYGVLAGADFGGGIWDLFASGPRKKEQRRAIANAMSPVWEANHVWLIFLIVLLFAGFPRAFAALSIALFVPLHLALIGITLRGAAFVFRAYGPSGPQDGARMRRWGIVFGIASVITPVLFGASMGAVSVGALRVGGGVGAGAHASDVSESTASAWLSPLPITMGAMALALCAYMAAVFLLSETDGALREDYRRRALWAGTAVVSLSVLALPIALMHAPHFASRLVSARALPVLIPGVLFALASGLAILMRWWKVARVCAAAHVALLICGFGLAQYPYLIYPDVTIHAAAAPASTLRFLAYSVVPGGALLVPSMWFLFRVFKTTKR